MQQFAENVLPEDLTISHKSSNLIKYVRNVLNVLSPKQCWRSYDNAYVTKILTMGTEKNEVEKTIYWMTIKTEKKVLRKHFSCALRSFGSK